MRKEGNYEAKNSLVSTPLPVRLGHIYMLEKMAILHCPLKRSILLEIMLQKYYFARIMLVENSIPIRTSWVKNMAQMMHLSMD